jgi:hypothetical protein
MKRRTLSIPVAVLIATLGTLLATGCGLLAERKSGPGPVVVSERSEPSPAPESGLVPAAQAQGENVALTTVETKQRPQDFSPPSPQHPLDVRFGDRARLVGYDLPGGTDTRPGSSLTLVLYWQAMGTFEQHYTAFAHLVDADNRIVGQRDQVPGGGDFPTTSWVPGEYLADTYAIPVNSNTPPNDYWIEVGFYDSLDGTRLPVTDADGHPLGDRLLLKEAEIRLIGN